ncbi:MAG: signal peptidase I [Bacillota bacterium]
MIPLDRESVPSAIVHREGTLDGIDPDAVVAGPPTWFTVARELLQTILLALFLAFLLRLFFIDTYLIDGPSMQPSLSQGERLLVNKMVYYLRRPVPGEIVVFQEPGRQGRNLVKRVVAVEGQTLEIREGRVILDGVPMEEYYISNPGKDSLPPQRIPAGYVFVMGDNRANSWDSRYFGAVPVRDIRGMAFLIFWPPESFHRIALEKTRGGDARFAMASPARDSNLSQYVDR